VAVTAVGLAAAYYGWFRDSSLVAVRDVRVQGVQGADRDRIVSALTRAAREMTTLHLQPERLGAAVRTFPTVASVSADPDFPHALTIHVTEREPALVVRAGDREIPAASDGTLLPGVDVRGELPVISADGPSQAGRLTGDALQEALVVGAVPAPLRPLIEGISMDATYGVVVTLRGGIGLRFGTGRRASAKWRAAAAVLADPGLTGLSYLDVRVPQRPAASGA
jgi:cell division protein FtsQ